MMSHFAINARFMIALAAAARRKGKRAHAAYYLNAAAFERKLAMRYRK